MTRQATEIVPHEHCAEGACETCDCCAAGWCVAFQDDDPYPQQFYGYSEPYSQRLIEHARATFDLWASMVLDAWEVEARPLADVIKQYGRPAAQPRNTPARTHSPPRRGSRSRGEELPPMTRQATDVARRGHSVTIEFEESGYWPSLIFDCHEPEDAICRTVCPNPECEEACFHVGEPGHERVSQDECTNLGWFENGDDVAGWIAGGRGATTAVTVPVEVSWDRGEDGPDWRFAEDNTPGMSTEGSP